MKICMLMYMGNMYSGGQGIYVDYLSREFVRMGHEVHVITGPPCLDLDERVTVHEVEAFNYFLDPVKAIAQHPRPWRVFKPLNFYEFATTRVGMFPLMFAYSFRAFARLRSLQKRHRFDVVHDNQHLGYGLLLMKRMGIPVVATLHHPLKIDREEAIAQAAGPLEFIDQMMFYPFFMQDIVTPRLDRIITVSQSAAQAIERAVPITRADKLRIVYNGVDTDQFRPDAMAEKVPGRIIYVGNTEDRKKGVRFLLEALSLLQREGEDFHLILVDRAKEDLELVPELLTKWGLDDRVTITGRVSRDELAALYRTAELAVSPSLYEGFGFPAAEAMASGVPTIATQAGAFPEVISDREAGWLVPPGNPVALADAIAMFLSSPVLRERFGRAGREHIVRKFNWRRAADETLAVYEEVMPTTRRHIPVQPQVTAAEPEPETV
ncbi:MAG TPA: glycosyltransferase family 4 protein [Dehalococcoidia bacterium]|nr:glycosyltransferase family 4 protein [Dehalococcoidia bacterium]